MEIVCTESESSLPPQINTIVNELKSLSTPVYTPESTNHYQAILK